MERGDAQILGLSTVVLGLVLVGGPWWWVSAGRRRKLGLITLAGMSAGVVILLLGIFYSLYAFNPNAGR
ncbi:MAG: hypothetical protein EPO16_02660 [Dehalococcoidia bacterium]|nr:MAG: hypothetical protein EPO16_02660 [Dehalococcoidia bacterium]